MRVNDLADDEQTQPETAGTTVPFERVEHSGELFARDRLTAVSHGHDDVVRLLSRRKQPDLGTPVLDGVRDQIRQRLFDPAGSQWPVSFPAVSTSMRAIG